MAKKTTSSLTTQIRKKITEGQVIVGTKLTLDGLREGKVSKVYLTQNCPEEVKEEVNHLSSLGKVEIVQLQVSNEELGTVCKKPFSISVLGLKA